MKIIVKFGENSKLKTMKKLLLILLCVPMIGFGQCISGDCENGYGTYIWANGDKCVGEWKDGLSQGLATFTFGKGEWEGDKYVGEYKNDKMHGLGTYTFASGDKYVGEYKNNKMHGLGTYTFPSGNKYVGEFKYGLFHGQGTFTHTDGKIEKGLWRNDEFIGEE